MESEPGGLEKQLRDKAAEALSKQDYSALIAIAKQLEQMQKSRAVEKPANQIKQTSALENPKSKLEKFKAEGLLDISLLIKQITADQPELITKHKQAIGKYVEAASLVEKITANDFSITENYEIFDFVKVKHKLVWLLPFIDDIQKQPKALELMEKLGIEQLAMEPGSQLSPSQINLLKVSKTFGSGSKVYIKETIAPGYKTKSGSILRQPEVTVELK